MFKSWRGKARSFAGGVWKRFRVFWLPLSTKRKLVYTLPATIALVIAIYGMALLIGVVHDRLTAPKSIPTPEQAMQDNLQRLLDNPPKKTAATQQKVDYYRQLSVARADDKDYKAAAEAISSQANANLSNITYSDYMQQAIYYHQAKNDNAAMQSLDKASAAIAKQGDPASDDEVAVTQDHILTLRQEYAK